MPLVETKKELNHKDMYLKVCDLSEREPQL